MSDLLKRFAAGNTGKYDIQGTHAIVNGNPGMLIESIAPAGSSMTSTTNARADPPVTSQTIGIDNHQYTVCEFTDP